MKLSSRRGAQAPHDPHEADGQADSALIDMRDKEALRAPPVSCIERRVPPQGRAAPLIPMTESRYTETHADVSMVFQG